MTEEIFHKEADALEQARIALDHARGLDRQVDSAFRTLIKRYAKLLRQSGRMATMGDRIQNSLNSLNRELAASESKYRGVFESVAEGIYRCRRDGCLIEINPSMAAMFGFSCCEEFLEVISNIKQLFCSRKDFGRYESLLVSNGVHRQEVQVCGPDDQTLWVEISASFIPVEKGEPETVVGVLADVTERKKMLEDMCRLARTDSLTGLWNRGFFMEQAGREVARSLRSGGELSLLLLDVDFFKAVNDTYGHDVGDHALIGIADTIRAAVREVDIVGRYGGEEFVVLLPDTSIKTAAMVAERVTSQLRAHRLECGSVKITATVSIGLTSFREGDDLDSLLRFADIALYAAKKKGRDRVEAYQRESQVSSDCQSSQGAAAALEDRQ